LVTTLEASVFEADDEKEIAIIDAARKTFLARGFEAASMDAIALLAAVSKRTVYNRFRSKEELFAAAILQTCMRILPVDVEAIEASLPPEKFIREMSGLFVHAILEPEALALRRIAAFEATRKPALGKSYLTHGPRFMAKTCAPMLSRLAARGALRIEDPERAIWQLGALITEPLYTEVLMGDPPADLERAISEQIDSGIRAFMKLYGV
jgi:TetR/AcrR family transcriptional repressor of mexJK operon